MSKRFVIYEDIRWQVTGETKVDNRTYLELRRKRRINGVWKTFDVLGEPEHCVPDDRPVIRRFKFGGFILEFETQSGIVWIRRPRERRSEKNQTSLSAIHSMTIKAHVALKKSLRAAKRRAKGGKR